VTAAPVALVTGGAAGIGRALVHRLADGGYRVVVVDRDSEGAAAAAKAVEGTSVSLDLTDPAASTAAVEAAVSAYGRLDVACLNAGIATGAWDVETIDVDRYRAVVALNQDAVFYGARAAIPALRAAGGGTIVATASLGGLIGQADDPVYCMTKHAVVGLVRSLAMPLSAHGIRIVALCPGFVDTPLLAPYLESFRAAKYPLLVPEDVAEAAILAIAAGGTGEAWVVQPGRDPEPYRFRGLPGPRAEGYEGALPPGFV
jgi:NAD(P)-dependent dehydrogenase (short-subunit alcohol dehydrogenase family)